MFDPVATWGEVLEAEGHQVWALRKTGMAPLIELDVLANGGMVVSARQQGTSRLVVWSLGCPYWQVLCQLLHRLWRFLIPERYPQP